MRRALRQPNVYWEPSGPSNCPLVHTATPATRDAMVTQNRGKHFSNRWAKVVVCSRDHLAVFHIPTCERGIEACATITPYARLQLVWRLTSPCTIGPFLRRNCPRKGFVCWEGERLADRRSEAS